MANSNSVFSMQHNLFFIWSSFLSDFSCHTWFVKVFWRLVLQLSDIYYFLRYTHFHYKFSRLRNDEICLHCTPNQSFEMGTWKNPKAISGHLYSNSHSKCHYHDCDERFRSFEWFEHKKVFQNEKWRPGNRYLETNVSLQLERNWDRWIKQYSSSKWYTEYLHYSVGFTLCDYQ